LMKWFGLIYGLFNMYVASCHVVSSKVMKSHESDENWICLDPRRIKIELFELKL